MRPVGSDFPTAGDDVRTDGTNAPPWRTQGEDGVYVETGRQALVLIGRHVETLGIGTVLVPGHLCSSMVEPFVLGGWTVLPYDLDPGLDPDLDHLASIARRAGSRVAVLMAPYFGLRPPASFDGAVAQLRAEGAVVIIDETHSLLDRSTGCGDLRFASLRKVLPVGDGAYVQGEHLDLLDAASGPSDSVRWDIMDEMARSERPDRAHDTRERLVAANLAFEQSRTVRRATPRTLVEVEHLDYDRIRRRRRSNSLQLAAALDGEPRVHVVNHPDRCGTPSHLVLSVADPHELQRRLAARAVFCPIHWPEVDLGPTSRPWRHDLISIPVDHRYGPEDMARVGDEIRRQVR